MPHVLRIHSVCQNLDPKVYMHGSHAMAAYSTQVRSQAQIGFVPPVLCCAAQVSGLEEALNVKLPTDLESQEARKMLVRGL